MVIEIFEGNIAVPAKCGTRYFSKCVKSPERPVGYMERVVSCLPQQSDITRTIGDEKSRIEDYELWKGVKWLVVRDSYEWLESALHTELVSCHSDIEKVSGIIDDFVSPWGNTHWHGGFFKKIHFLYKNHNIKRFKILQITETTKFLSDLGYDIEYIKDEYSFYHVDNWKSKKEIVEMVKNEFPTQWEMMLNLIKGDREYYEYVVNNKVKLI
jgi:hypothetical protein